MNHTIRKFDPDSVVQEVSDGAFAQPHDSRLKWHLPDSWKLNGSEAVAPNRDVPAWIDEAMQLLYAYIEVELDGDDAAAAFPQVHHALQSSSYARMRYEELQSILSAEREGTLVIPTQVPTFDFSYLQEPTVGQLDSWRWDGEVRRLIVEFSEQLLQTFQYSINPMASKPMTAVSMKPSAKLSSNPAGVWSERSLCSTESAAERLTLQIDKSKEEDLRIRFEVIPTTYDQTVCDVTVTVDRPSVHGAPIMADSRIFLTRYYPDKRACEIKTSVGGCLGLNEPSEAIPLQVPTEETILQTTDPFGQTTFHQIPVVELPRLLFAIEPVGL
ncbi:MAG: hypothetical protein AAF702_11445 [Chloroflexota bacterium]